MQTTATGPAPSRDLSFNGIGNLGGFIPPDPNGDVGPNDYVQAVNDSFAVYDKQGHRLLGPQSVPGLWKGFGGMCQNNGQGDPIVLYDPLADRFLLSEFAYSFDSSGAPTGPYYECIAVTRTGDPTGSWYRYAFLISQTKMDDYPKLGVWPDGYYLTVNQFTSAGDWQGVGVAAFDRTAMLGGQNAAMVYLDSPASGSLGLLPADLDGTDPPPAGSPEYFVGFDAGKWGAALQLWGFHVDWADPQSSTFTGPASIPTAPFDATLCDYNRDCIRQPGTSQGLDASSYRIMYRLAYRNFGDHESMVVSHTVDVGGDHAGVRWYEIRDPRGNPSVAQQGTYAPDGADRFVPSAAMDGSGDIAVGYSVSGPNTYPSIRYAGHEAADPPGTLGQEGTLVAGGGSQLDGTHRWGDYTSLSVDPSDGCTFWYTGEYYASTSGDQWSTRIGTFRYPSCAPGQPPPPPPPSGQPALSIQDDTVAGTDGAPAEADFPVTLSPTGDQPVTVGYETLDGSATAGSDFVPTSGTLTFQPGETDASVTVPLIGDPSLQGTKRFFVTLTGATGAVLARDVAVGTILGADARLGPDAEIRGHGSWFVGKGVRNLKGWHQTVRRAAKRGITRVFLIMLRNEGSVAQRYALRGAGKSPRFLVRYRMGRTKWGITRRVAHGAYTVLVPPGGRRYVRMLVTVRRGSLTGVTRAFLVVARSRTGQRDAVRAVVHVAR